MEYISLYLSVGSWWWYALCLVGVVSVAILGYSSTQPEIPRSSKLILISLRTMGMSLLLLALFGPLLHSITSQSITPRVAVVVDASASMQIKDRLGMRRDAADTVITKILNGLSNNLEFYTLGEFAERIEEFNADSITYTQQRTSLSQGINTVSNESDRTNVRAVLMVTDGNHNTGESPLYLAERSGLPVFSIGVGDTIPPADASADAMIAPAFGVVGEPLAITVEVSWKGLGDSQTEITLYDQGAEVAKQTVYLTKDGGATLFQFQTTPATQGVHKYSARIKAVSGEFSTKNNVAEQYVDVRSNKRTVVLIAGAPSSDVAFITQVFKADAGIDLQVFIQKQGTDYYSQAPTAEVLRKAELCVLIGFPITSTSNAVIELVARAAEKGTPLLFVSSSTIDYSKLRALGKVLPFTVNSTRATEFQVTANVSAAAAGHPLLRIGGEGADVVQVWNDLPPVFMTEALVTPTSGARILSTIKVNNTALPNPLIMVSENGEARCLAILGYGLYRWKLLEDAPRQARGQSKLELFDSFIQNAAGWLGVKNSEKRVVIEPNRRFYSANEQIRFTGTVLDASMLTVSNAQVALFVQSTKTKQEYVLAPQGNGRYYSAIGSLPAGDYTYLGTASAKGTTLGKDQGRFSVSDVGIEDAATWCNQPLLRELATRSNAAYGHAAQADSIIQAVLAHRTMQDFVISREREQLLWHLPWMIIAAISAFSTEWFLRKRRGLL